jgi:hypothetical protein
LFFEYHTLYRQEKLAKLEKSCQLQAKATDCIQMCCGAPSFCTCKTKNKVLSPNLKMPTPRFNPGFTPPPFIYIKCRGWTPEPKSQDAWNYGLNPEHGVRHRSTGWRYRKSCMLWTPSPLFFVCCKPGVGPGSGPGLGPGPGWKFVLRSGFKLASRIKWF